MTDAKDLSRRLQDPFSPDDIEWRVQRCGVSGNRAWVAVLAYVTNRAIQQRLDDVVGMGSWKNEYTPSPDGKGFLCGLSIKFKDEWVTKWDGAECTEIEPLKGGLSGSMKRAAVQYGIGRYLYNLETFFADCSEVKSRREAQDNFAMAKVKDGSKETKIYINWKTPALPPWALPGIETDDYSKNIKDAESLAELKQVFADAYRYAKTFGRTDLQERFKSEYDTAKAKLDASAQENIESAFKEVSEWLGRELKAVAMVSSESGVTRVCQTFRAKVKAKSEGQYYDATNLLKQIDSVERKRLREIKNQHKGAQK